MLPQLAIVLIKLCDSLCLCDSVFVHPVAQFIHRWTPGQKTPVRVAPALDIALPAGMAVGATCQNEVAESSLLYISLTEK